MRLPRGRAADVAVISTLLFPAGVLGITLDCSRVIIEKHSFDLSALGGPHSVMNSVAMADMPGSFLNTTFTIDICRPLVRSDNPKADEECVTGTRVCAIQRTIDPVAGTDRFEKAIPIAGQLKDQHGGDLDPSLTRLSTSGDLEGVKIELKGGIYGKRKQKAVIDFICDPNRTGLEGEFDPEDKYGSGSSSADAVSTLEDEEPVKAQNASLTFVKFDQGKAGQEEDLLVLKWLTKYACENYERGDDNDAPAKGGWGFFTWFLLIAFLSIAAYLIFGSWLNYNRYGARGWDLLPHGDTIRDIPYLLKDWARRVINTVQGGGSRGGYSAV